MESGIAASQSSIAFLGCGKKHFERKRPGTKSTMMRIRIDGIIPKKFPCYLSWISVNAAILKCVEITNNPISKHTRRFC